MGKHSATSVIRLQNLTKSFGKQKAVDDLTFDVSAGEVLGFLGPNGAGKTTTMRMLTGLISPTSGSASILGFDASKRSTEMLANLGYLPGSLAVYQNLSGHEFLNFVAKIRKRNCKSEIADLSERLKLDLNKHIHDLSKGNRQKVGVIAAFMHKPDVLILDEPTGGLDPLMQREFEKMLSEAKQRGAAVLLSSHVMSEVEHLSDRVAIIHQGKLLMLDTMSALKLKAIHRIEFSFDAPVAASHFENLMGVHTVSAIENRIVCEVSGAETQLLNKAVELGALTVRTEEPSLDEIFLNLLNPGVTK